MTPWVKRATHLIVTACLMPHGTPPARAAVAGGAPDEVSSGDIDVALSVADELERAHRYQAARVQLIAVSAAVAGAQAEELRLRACDLWAAEASAHNARDRAKTSMS